MTSPDQNTVVAGFENLLELRHHARTQPDNVSTKFAAYCATNLMYSQAQRFQDLLVVFFLAGKRNGFFVEFGACNGLELSNTLLLERNFQWKGILAEPAACWHEALRKNRTASIDARCVWSASGGSMEFVETEAPELSTLSHLTDSDLHKEKRQSGKRYPVETVSLNDLLQTHNSPREIDYLSLDTEGSELDILHAFDFSRYDVKIMTVEHTFRDEQRQGINALLTDKGFVRVFEPFSQFDDWYIKRSIVGL